MTDDWLPDLTKSVSPRPLGTDKLLVSKAICVGATTGPDYSLPRWLTLLKIINIIIIIIIDTLRGIARLWLIVIPAIRPDTRPEIWMPEDVKKVFANVLYLAKTKHSTKYWLDKVPKLWNIHGSTSSSSAPSAPASSPLLAPVSADGTRQQDERWRHAFSDCIVHSASTEGVHLCTVELLQGMGVQRIHTGNINSSVSQWFGTMWRCVGWCFGCNLNDDDWLWHWMTWRIS